MGWATYAFIGLERIGGIMIFDISNPLAPEFIDYVNTRDFTGDPATDGAGDLAPEGLLFIPAWQSPTWKPLVVAAYEMSGSNRSWAADLSTCRGRCLSTPFHGHNHL